MTNKRTLLHHPVRRANAAALAMLLAGLCCAQPAFSQDEDNPLGAGARVPDMPLQELLKKRRPKGEIYLAVPQAITVADESSARKGSCLPQIQLINSSNQTIEELVAGIQFRKAGQVVGSTLSRFYLVKTGKQDMQYFPSALNTPDCEEMSGELDVIHCVYANGDSCEEDVRAVQYGTVPLKMQEKK